MRKTSDEMPPRARGLLLLGLATFMVVLNIELAHRMHTYYRALFPLAGFVSPLGVFLLVQGASVEDIRGGKVPRAVLMGVGAAMLAGVVLGLWANHVRFAR